MFCLGNTSFEGTSIAGTLRFQVHVKTLPIKSITNLMKLVVNIFAMEAVVAIQISFMIWKVVERLAMAV